MKPQVDHAAIRAGIARIPADVSNDAIGAHAPKIEDMFAPEAHSAALDPATTIVVGSRGAGKSFWSGVLGQPETKKAASIAYPRLGLASTEVFFGYTGVPGENGVGVEALDQYVPEPASREKANAFWWATILRALAMQSASNVPTFAKAMSLCEGWEKRQELFGKYEKTLMASKRRVLVVFDALDTVGRTWDRRRFLTESLLEVAWATRGYRNIKVKLFLRPDQIDDDALRFVELPKLRTGAVRLEWSGRDLYGLFFSRLALSQEENAKRAFGLLLGKCGISLADSTSILSRQWSLVSDEKQQSDVMERLAGRYMASGPNGYKKGRTYVWPITHLADAFEEVTPRSFLGLLISAAMRPVGDQQATAITPEGIRDGLRAASKTRVDQLHLEFPWIKGVLAPLSGLLLPQEADAVFEPWRKARTVEHVKSDARKHYYLPPFSGEKASERELFLALERIGVMYTRKDGRLDMPDLFRVAARLLKKGGTAPS